MSAALPPACVPEPDDGCSICGDEGRVGVLLSLPDEGSEGRVRMSDTGETARVALDLVAGAEPGDRLLVHMGFALALVREAPEGRPT